MRRGFEGAMRDYGDLSEDLEEAKRRRYDLKGTAGFASAQEDVTKVEGALEWHLDRRARFADTPVEAQQAMFALQKKKQKIMDRLQDALAALDAPEGKAGPEKKETGKDVRTVIAKGEELYWRRADGSELPVTVGEMVTDGEWGLTYAADASVPRIIRKRLIVERAKREIQDLLDEQIMTEELSSGRVHPMLKDAYAALRERRESGELPHGVIAEKMTAQLVRKKIIDDDAPYRYEPGDVFQDVVRKIDFVLRRADYGRGVRTEATDLGAKAVQLTVNRDAQALARKRSQIGKTREMLQESDRIDDIALVQLDQGAIAGAYRAWERAGRPPGGPDKYLAEDARAQMFTELVAGMERPSLDAAA